jgi:hypothetical protein
LLIDTLKARRRGYSERATRKVMNGGGVKASPRQPEESPQELKTREGIEWTAGLNRLSSATDRCSDKALKAS